VRPGPRLAYAYVQNLFRLLRRSRMKQFLASVQHAEYWQKYNDAPEYIVTVNVQSYLLEFFILEHQAKTYVTLEIKNMKYYSIKTI
jgi:hypothetical protein